MLKYFKEKWRLLKNRYIAKKYPYLVGEGISETSNILWFKDIPTHIEHLSEIPKGWYGLSFKLFDEINVLLKKYGDCINKLIIRQYKEKYGTIRLYWYIDGVRDGSPIYNGITNIIAKYEKIASNTCCKCGKKAKWVSHGYILPYCDKHFNKHFKNGHKI